jgi:uncharacterized protein YbaR (Trm112 family)
MTETARPAKAGPIDAELLALLVCPVDKQPLTLLGETLVCSTCQRRYPIVDGIPNMLVDDE